MVRGSSHLVAPLLGILSFFVAGLASAQSVATGASGDGRGIEVTADKLSAGNGAAKIEASGNVEIKREQTTLKADEVRVDRDTQDVEAKGRVSVDRPEWKIKSADSVQLNLEKETGEIQNGDIFIEQGHVSIMGRRLQKFGGQTYHIDDSFFTTCLCESGAPHWKFSAEQMDLSLEGVGTIQNGYFYVLDVPVFYLPYGIFPLRTERQTGFLFPQFGSSTKEGFRYQQPFFWAISKSTDASLSFDIQSRARVGVIGELRTIINRDSDFLYNSSFFNETFRKDRSVQDNTIADPVIPQNRWSVVATHRYITTTDWLTYSDVAAFRDDLFTRELVDRFDVPGRREADIRASRFSDSRFGVYRNWGDMFLQGEWKFYQDFIQPDSGTFQRTPQVAFWGQRYLAGFPLEFRWRAEAINYMRRKGSDGLRLDLYPEAVLPFRLAQYFFGSFSAAPRSTLYHLYTPVKSSDRNVSRELVEIRGQIGTRLNRVFAWTGLGLAGVKHVLEPELSYLFVPGTNQSDIPIMDGVDRINRRNVVTFAVANRFLGKFANPVLAAAEDKEAELINPVGFGGVRELAHWRLALSYDVDKERNGGDSLTDLDMHLRLNPTSYLSVSFDGGFDPGPWQVTQARTGLALNDPRPMMRRSLDPDFNRPNSFNFNFSYLRRGPNAVFADDANIDFDMPVPPPPNPYCNKHPTDPRCFGSVPGKTTVGNLSTNVFYHLTDHAVISLTGIYSIIDSHFLGVRAATKLLSTCECWSITLGLKRNINPAKTSFSFDFNLLGLGSSKSALQ
jgi:LPS-assembly protein